MHCFRLNESALSDKGEVGLFKCKSSGVSTDVVKLKTSVSDGLEVFFSTLKSLRMYQLPCAVHPCCFHTVTVNAVIHQSYLDRTMASLTVL